MGATSHWLGEFQCHSNASKAGYATGVLISTAASLFYGGAEAKLVARCGKSLARANRFFEGSKAVKSLAETKNVVKLTEKASPTTQKISRGFRYTVHGEDFLTAEQLAKRNVRITPRNLQEQLVLKEAKYNPGKRIMKNKIEDSRYPNDVWAKKQYIYQNPYNHQHNHHIIEIHYWENLNTGYRKGFKFKN